MSADLLPFPKKKFTSEGGGDSGPEDPMLDQRVQALEADVKDVKQSLNRLEVAIARVEGVLTQMPKQSDLAVLRSEIGEIRGRISNMPTWWMLIVAIITTWSAGAAIVFALIRNAAK